MPRQDTARRIGRRAKAAVRVEGHSGQRSVPSPVRLPRLPRLPPAWLPPLLCDLPGAGQRRRALTLAALAGLAVALRSWPPFLWLPGWVVGLLLLLAVAELLRWLWRPRRWR